MAPPFVFEARGLIPNVRLEVFGTVFEVHSVILKIHSTFFSNFFDSHENIKRKGIIEYEWITCIDSEDSWHLVPKELGKNYSHSEIDFSGYEQAQIESFKNLLNAMYGLPYEIYHHKSLAILAELADYYCALPVLSRSLCQVLVISDLEVYLHYKALAPLARKLQHKDLFKDCIIHLAGSNWSQPFFDRTDGVDEELKNIVMRAHNRIRLQIADAHAAVFDLRKMFKIQKAFISQQPYKSYDLRDGIENFELAATEDASLPRFYFGIADALKHHSISKDTLEPLERTRLEQNIDKINRVAANNLKFINLQSLTVRARLIDSFLCATVPEEDIPWDSKQTDW